MARLLREYRVDTPAELRRMEAERADMIDATTGREHIFQLDPRMQPTMLSVAQRAQCQPFLAH